MAEIKTFFPVLEGAEKSEVKKLVLTCDKHGKYESEIVIYKNGFQEMSSGCPECIKEQEEAYERRLKKDKEEFYRSLNIEPEFFYKSFEDYKPCSASQKKALEAVKRMVEQKHGKVILVGSNGVGKTMLASIAAKMLKGKIYSMYEITTMIRQSYTIKAEKTELEIVRELASVPFLAIDELGRTKGGETEQNWLSYILDKRHCRKLPFMLMSNGHFKKYCKVGGCSRCFENFVDNDILSRLHQDSSVIIIDGPDNRVSRQ